MSLVKKHASSIVKLSDEAIKDLENLFSLKKYKKGEIIDAAGKTPKNTFLLIEGIARSYTLDKKGKEHIRSIFIPVSVFCSLTSLILKTPATSTYACITECTVFEGNWDAFILLTKKHHDIALLHIKNLENAFINIEGRVNSLSTLNATERYLELKKIAPDIEKLIPLYQVAAYLNITPIQFSRIRKALYSK